jgi:riboflavin kinase/FMN adenylyltransferase
MMNLGPRPTFGDSKTSIEAHLFDSEGDYYDCNVRIDFVARLRATKKFPSVEELKSQLKLDERDARTALTLPSRPGNLKG